MDWIKKTLVNILLVCVSIGFAFGVAELALHFTSIQYQYLYPLEPSGYLSHDPELGFDITPSFATSTHHFYDFAYPVWSNSLGCFDYEYDGSSPYIYVTGDSFAWGFTPLNEKWGKSIERATGIRTLTCGVNAFGSRQEVIKARKTLEKFSQSPKLIVVSYLGTNDAYDDMIFPNFTAYKGYRVTEWNHCSPENMIVTSPLEATSTCSVEPPKYTFLQKVKFQLATHSVLYMVATRQFGFQNMTRSFMQTALPNSWVQKTGLVHTAQPTFDEGSNVQTERAHEFSIQSFKMLAKKYDTRLLFVLIPDKYMVRATSTDPMWQNEKMKRYLQKEHIEFIDLLPELRARERLPEYPLYWDFDGHWNISGNKEAGEIISKYILDNGLVSEARP